MICPRRIEGVRAHAPKEDEWQLRGGHRCCSWCGSLHPDEFLKAAEAGKEIVPTDKDYKVYIRDPGQLKVYFQHFDEVQKRQFIDLYNAHKMKLDFPHHFYVMPFFARREDRQPPRSNGI